MCKKRQFLRSKHLTRGTLLGRERGTGLSVTDAMLLFALAQGLETHRAPVLLLGRYGLEGHALARGVASLAEIMALVTAGSRAWQESQLGSGHRRMPSLYASLCPRFTPGVLFLWVLFFFFPETLSFHVNTVGVGSSFLI